MRPTSFIATLFILIGLVALALIGALVWASLNLEAFSRPEVLILAGIGAGAFFLFGLTLAWALIQLRLVKPISALTREIETLTHADKARQINMPDPGLTGGLTNALDELIAKFLAAREKRQQAIDEAVQSGETYRRRLETILLDLSEGVIVCNLDHRILLYNQSAAEILKQPETLGLGRRLFGIFERKAILAAVSELTKEQRGDKTRKLRTRRRVTCERRDGGDAIDVRLALICSDEVETEGYVLTFNGTEEPGKDIATSLPPRPEFYDFDLFRCPPDRDLEDIPLKELRCVVFDAETTGLQPSKGDELISIGAVRVVNARVVRGETFYQLINPGKKIPKDSIKFHGITDKDVKDKPRVAEVLPRFYRFCGRSVLVAHNAAFDMKFLELKEKVSGIKFTNPVLDVLLLSSYLHDHESDHSLDASAKRLGISVSNRHTALGDAMTTAEIYLSMLGPLEQRGVVTLGDALKVSSEQVEVRKMQAQF